MLKSSAKFSGAVKFNKVFWEGHTIALITNVEREREREG